MTIPFISYTYKCLYYTVYCTFDLTEGQKEQRESTSAAVGRWTGSCAIIRCMSEEPRINKRSCRLVCIIRLLCVILYLLV